MRMLSIEPLRRDDHATNHRLADVAADRLLDDEAASSFEYAGAVDGIDLYRTSHGVKAVTVVRGTVQSLVHSLAMDSSTSQSFRKRMFQYFGESFVDGVRLHSDPSPVSLHWLALQHDHNMYDLTFLTSTHAYDDSGAPLAFHVYDDPPLTAEHMHVGVQVWQPAMLPGRATTDSISRLALLHPSGFVIESNGPTTCTVSFLLQFQSVPPASVLSMDGIQHLAVSATRWFRTGMHGMTIVPKSLWTHNAYCYLCFKSFGVVFARRHHCRLCGHAICATCTTYAPLPVQVLPHQRRSPPRVPICFKCPESLAKTVSCLHDQEGPSPHVVPNVKAITTTPNNLHTQSTFRLTDATSTRLPSSRATLSTHVAHSTHNNAKSWGEDDVMDVVPILESVKPKPPSDRHHYHPHRPRPPLRCPPALLVQPTKMRRRGKAAGLFRISPTDCTLVYASKTAPSEVGSELSSSCGCDEVVF
ncbi:hypothetical protein B5M09_007250 [Aphanomyces astaci]|uniref:FYVE-type domain-containing protein n=1 Tax=Aphanomyces astaci TaxID=112090 RepID=A0A425DJ95_APHAT|nr:hypothetical protein B5M09_007250 [Aphanomyces astaci]